ncbi:MAG: deoxyguanosinetriphosphate triphosphohydrolase [Fimbriimonadaceae bacterium]|nr:deoxyguanosinetriphosphate triphosphohydrolase [Fimbriimonadaceae bacterium]
MTIREQIEERESASLSPFATLSAHSQGRAIPEPLDPVRTAFMKDRDRILHSKPFRRLKHKTQVFIAPVGDHYRTRLTHTLEVTQISRTIARALRLNEDLTEAIALGHDIGHPPFGHAGERALDDALAALNATEGPKQFHHSEHSLRVVDILAKLNLTQETRSGIGGHSKGRADLDADESDKSPSLEAAVVRVSDRIAYMSHDLDDAIRSGIILAPPESFAEIGTKPGEWIEAMVMDVIEHSTDSATIRLSGPMRERMNHLKEWLFERVYLEYPRRNEDVDKAEKVIRELLTYYAERGNLPEGFSGVQGAVDYVAGMTDRFALATYRRVFLPTEFEERILQTP